LGDTWGYRAIDNQQHQFGHIWVVATRKMDFTKEYGKQNGELMGMSWDKILPPTK
jgi:hypothetical protein